MKSIYIYLLTMMSSVLCSGQTDDRMILLIKPTGNSLNAYPLMEEFHDTSSAYRSVMSVIDSSAIKEFLGVYKISQQFLVNRGCQQKKEPAYLALTSNQGGYAKKGFYLVNLRGDTIDRTQASYVDIMLDRLFTDYKGLMSFTQLYPHELAHVIYGQVSINDSMDPESRNVDMHYFPVITDYSTAFNEGFAIHFENISRLIENNQDIRSGIQEDLENIEQRSPNSISGFINDIRCPLRLGYYSLR